MSEVRGKTHKKGKEAKVVISLSGLH